MLERKLRDLLPDAKNANRGTERGSQMIENSLRHYGAGRSILIDKNGRIIAGNKTAEHAGCIGLDDVLVIQTDGRKLVAVQRTDLETDAAAKELAIADNRSGQVSLEWDPAVLQELDVDLAKFWTPGEIEALMASIAVTAELLTDEDAVPAAPESATTKPGDIYVMGNHRLLCGDATHAADYARLMDGYQADLVVTDPPYNVDYVGKTKDALKIQNDKKSAEAFYEFLLGAHRGMLSVMKDGAGIYVFHADLEGVNFRRALLDSGLKLAACCVWVKQSMVMGRSDYQWQHEPVLYGWKPTAAHRWYSDRRQTTVWNFDRPSRSEDHPTMKPVALIEYPIQNSSRGGDVVLDPFGGSGTTLIACEKHGRSARLMELDPIYCDVIVERWELATGKKAERFCNGPTPQKD